MKKVLILSALLVLVCSLPTFAYQVNWTETFDSYTASEAGVNLTGQGGWFTPTTPASLQSGYVVNPGATSVPSAPRSESNYYKQKAGVSSANAKDLSALTLRGTDVFANGYIKAWIWDLAAPSAVNNCDTRVAIFGEKASASGFGSGYGVFAQIQPGVVTNGSGASYWRAQWSYETFALDNTSAYWTGGAGIRTAAGWTITCPKQTPRKTAADIEATTAWNSVRIEWVYAYPRDIYGNMTSLNPTSLSVFWHINCDPADAEFPGDDANLRLDCDTTTGRGANMAKGMRYAFLGSAYGAATDPRAIDNYELHANVIPEPSSFLALGTGLVGLLGLIRRRR